MGMHMCAFEFTAGNTGAGVFTTVPPVLDSWLGTSPNNRFVIPGGMTGSLSPWRLRAGYVQGTGTTVARVFNAYMRRIQLPSLTPVRPGATVDTAFAVIDYGTNGPVIPFSDEFGIDADNTGANVQTGFLWLHDGANIVPPGEVFSTQFLCTNGGSTTQATTVANTWTAANLAFSQSLPPGRYSIIGLDVFGTTLEGARFIPSNNGPRPGCLARASSSIYPSNQFRMGNFGTWLEFQSYSPPLIELFNSAAVTAGFTGTMDLVKVG